MGAIFLTTQAMLREQRSALAIDLQRVCE